jgi:hypothetical protein
MSVEERQGDESFETKVVGVILQSASMRLVNRLGVSGGTARMDDPSHIIRFDGPIQLAHM